MRVLKYPVELGAMHANIPFKATVAHVAFQRHLPTVWAFISDEDAAITRIIPATRKVTFFATGDDVPETLKFVGTILTQDTSFVLHAFEEIVQ